MPILFTETSRRIKIKHKDSKLQRKLFLVLQAFVEQVAI